MELPTHRAWFDRVYPQLCERLLSYGGRFISDEYASPVGLVPTKDGIKSASLALRYLFPNGSIVRIVTKVMPEGFTWKRETWAYHYGPDQRDITDTFFRIVRPAHAR